MGGIAKAIGMGSKSPAAPVAVPAAPTAASVDVGAATQAAATAQGRAATMTSASSGSMDDGTTDYSVRKKLLGS